MKRIFNKFLEKCNSLKLNTKFTALIVIVFTIPIGFLAGVIYYNMEQSVISENITYMGYTMERNETTVETALDSINMTTQFIVSDDNMAELLNTASTGQSLSKTELLNFSEGELVTIERLVNNNPLLYGVRVYAINDNVVEMMPVIYTNSRMQNMSWASEDEIEGWHFGFHDTLFSSHLTSQEDSLLSLVTPIEDYKNGIIGYVEIAMDMETMFPSLYEDVGNEFSCLITDDGQIYFGDGVEQDEEKESLIELVDDRTEDSDTFYLKSGHKRYVISYIQLDEIAGKLICVRDITDAIYDIYASRNLFILVAILIIILLTILINYIVNRMLRQFYEILRTMNVVEKGDISLRIDTNSNDEMGILSKQLNDMLDSIEKLMKDNINREVLAKNSEIRALQNQINAHFIYNVLETIKMMAEIDEEYAISDAITSLGKLLRYSMRWASGNVKIYEELEYIKNYVALVNLRFDYEIILSINIPEELLEQPIPKMSLQPIVENAILHGVEDVAEDTTIYIKAFVKEKHMYIEITDSGKGMTEEQVDALKLKIAGEIETGGGSGNGIGLKNVQDRITMAFGEGYGLDIASQIDCYTKIIVDLPFEKGDISL